MTKSEARDAKKTAVPAHSSGLPKRPAGVRLMISWYNNSGGELEAAVVRGAVKSVSIHPGAIAFTWILNGASSIAIDLVSCTKAPFAAL